MNKDSHISVSSYSYVVFYLDRARVIAGYPQMAFRIVRALSVDGAINFMESEGVKEEDIQSIDKKE